MKAIFKRTETVTDDCVSVRIELFGVRIYELTSTDRSTDKNRPRPVGFIQFPIEAPSVVEADDYFPDEEI